jgi:1-acyl-sn-glycerol-3-phosphate acyltransferase
MKSFFRILFFPLTLLRFMLLCLITILFTLIVIVEDLFCKEKGSYKFRAQRSWGKTILFILGIRVKRNTIPSISNYILMPNHHGYLDIFLMATYSPSAFVAKAELLKWPVIGRALKSARTITVKRNEMRSLLNTMQEIRESIANDISVTIFPEGTTSFGPGLLPFKNGSFKIAAEFEIPIIPCAILYKDTNDAWVGKDNFIPHFFRQMWKPTNSVKIHFGEPVINPSLEELKAEVRNRIEQGLHKNEYSKTGINPLSKKS